MKDDGTLDHVPKMATEYCRLWEFCFDLVPRPLANNLGTSNIRANVIVALLQSVKTDTQQVVQTSLCPDPWKSILYRFGFVVWQDLRWLFRWGDFGDLR